MKAKTSPTINVKHISVLAKIPITKDEETKLTQGFATTLTVVDRLNQLDTKNVEPTHQVTGLENVFREDTVNEKRMLSQKQALKNAKRTHNGFFVVPPILDQNL